jgi:hypothetical protein
VFIEGRLAAVVGGVTEHCEMAAGTISGGSPRVFFGEGSPSDFVL